MSWVVRQARRLVEGRSSWSLHSMLPYSVVLGSVMGHKWCYSLLHSLGPILVSHCQALPSCRSNIAADRGNALFTTPTRSEADERVQRIMGHIMVLPTSSFSGTNFGIPLPNFAFVHEQHRGRSRHRSFHKADSIGS